MAKKVTELIRLIAFGRHVGEAGGHQRTADAVAGGIQLRRAGRPLGGVAGGEEALAHVVAERPVRMFSVGVDPGDHQHGEPLRHRPADEGLPRIEIQDVVLVDPRRNDEQGEFRHRLCRRLILDELHDLVLVNDLAGRGGHVAPELEGAPIGLGNAQAAAAGFDIALKPLQSFHQIAGIAGEGCPQHFRIGEYEVGRRQRIYDLLDVEPRLVAGVIVNVIRLADHIERPPRRDEIRLLQEVEERIFLPFTIPEAAIVRVGNRHRGDMLAAQALPRALPKPGIPLPQPQLRIGQHIRVGEIGSRDGAEGPGYLVGRDDLLLDFPVDRISSPGHQVGDADRAGEHLAQIAGQLGRVGKRKIRGIIGTCFRHRQPGSVPEPM